MERNVSDLHEMPDGSLTAPDGTTYRRTPERVKRRSGDELIDAGAAVVTYVYPEGLRWFDGPEARRIWSQIAPRLILGRRPPAKDLQWTGHVWRSESATVMLRFDGEH